jgi:hypothetical protein
MTIESDPNIPSAAVDVNADFWRYEIGVNVLPAINKIAIVKWSEWQDNPIPEELHNQWKAEGLFDKGMAVITGKVWHREDRKHLFLVGIDADNRKAIDEFCSRNGKTITLQEFAANTLVEQHEDKPDRVHIYFYTTDRSLVKAVTLRNTLQILMRIWYLLMK